jgi:sulfite reductase (NADPH) flavoprotein alpha-component
MNAFSSPAPVIPEDAPFTAAQRAWLNGFLAGLYGGGAADSGMSFAEPTEEFPWHDPALDLAERLALAEGRPFPQRLMAAMGQLDCGQCGYLCQTYAEALAEGRESQTSLCVPGAKPTARTLKQLLTENPVTAASAPAAASPATGLPVRVLAANRLTGEASTKDVRHVVIDVTPSGLSYQPGDSLGVAAGHEPALVAACLAELRAEGHELVSCPDGTMRPLREAFTWQLDIARPHDLTTELLASIATNPEEAASLRRFAAGEDGAEPADADLLDLLQAFPSARPRLADLVASLPRLRPRLYSIASSQRAEPGQVHLCVSVVAAERRGRVRHGTASGFLAHRAADHGQILATVQPSHFRLPSDPATPLIMVGPGTGIAPFRAFLQERAATGQRGPAWLFFGDQHQATDFLFAPEIRAWLADGTLTRLDTAWSRDQARKIYVQDRMREHAADLWSWLQDGAHFYVCGDATHMARDVEAALRDIAAEHGNLEEHQARDWLASLARQGRYLRDVY